MPELPEVQTTVNGLRNHIIGLIISDVWSNYNSIYFTGKENIKDPAYYKSFKREIIGKKIVSIERRAKNILINLINEKTIIMHMKMTGHLLYGLYKFNPRNRQDPWQAIEPSSLKEPINRHIRFIITFNNGRYLALSDVRRFAKIIVTDTNSLDKSKHLSDLGPEPLDKRFSFEIFLKRLNLRPKGKIKQVITDQSILSGIGNIYADESLWLSGIHPAERTGNISRFKLKILFRSIRLLLSKGIRLGGDSMSDYRNVDGLKGAFQQHHRAYKQTGKPCLKRKCQGLIKRIVIGGRGTHYCPKHQRYNKKAAGLSMIHI